MSTTCAASVAAVHDAAAAEYNCHNFPLETTQSHKPIDIKQRHPETGRRGGENVKRDRNFMRTSNKNVHSDSMDFPIKCQRLL